MTTPRINKYRFWQSIVVTIVLLIVWAFLVTN
jgi:hypothetical protein